MTFDQDVAGLERVAAGLLLRDEFGRVLLAEPPYEAALGISVAVDSEEPFA